MKLIIGGNAIPLIAQQQVTKAPPPVGRTPWDLVAQAWAQDPTVFVMMAAILATAVLAHLWGRWLQKTWRDK